MNVTEIDEKIFLLYLCMSIVYGCVILVVFAFLLTTGIT